MQNPEKLQVAARARALALITYSVTAPFPTEERYGLTAQMRRAAISVGSNIHEGCGRNGGKELARFLQIALGSISELEFQMLVATDLGLLSSPSSAQLAEEANHTKRMLLRLIGAVQRTRGPLHVARDT
jgi:four helix bundle protein